MANTSLGINSPRLHLQEQDAELWSPQGMGKVALSVPTNCGVMRSHFTLSCIICMFILFFKRIVAEMDSGCTPRHLHGPVGWVSTCRALLLLHCFKSWECLKTFQPRQRCADSAEAKTGPLQMAALGAVRSFWYLQQVLASAAAMCSLGLFWRLGLTGESFCSAGDNHPAVPPAYLSDQLPFAVVIFSFFFPHM